MKQRGVSSESDGSAECEIEWDSHLTEETCKQLWFNYNGTEEYELCDIKYRLLEDSSTLLEEDCEYEKFECVSLKLLAPSPIYIFLFSKRLPKENKNFGFILLLWLL